MYELTAIDIKAIKQCDYLGLRYDKKYDHCHIELGKTTEEPFSHTNIWKIPCEEPRIARYGGWAKPNLDIHTFWFSQRQYGGFNFGTVETISHIVKKGYALGMRLVIGNSNQYEKEAGLEENSGYLQIFKKDRNGSFQIVAEIHIDTETVPCGAKIAINAQF